MSSTFDPVPMATSLFMSLYGEELFVKVYDSEPDEYIEEKQKIDMMISYFELAKEKWSAK